MTEFITALEMSVVGLLAVFLALIAIWVAIYAIGYVAARISAEEGASKKSA